MFFVEIKIKFFSFFLIFTQKNSNYLINNLIRNVCKCDGYDC